MKRFLFFLLCILFVSCSTSDYKPESSEIAISQTININNTLKDEIIAEEPAQVDAKLRAKLLENQSVNEDIVAVMQIPDTQLDVFVAYRDGSEEYYLNRDINGNYSVAGIPFMQQGFTFDSGNNVIIYGHYFKNGQVFGTLHNYINYPDYYENHKDITVVTNEKQYTYRIFAVSVMEIQEDDGFVYNSTQYKNFDTIEFDTFMSHILANNRCQTGESVTINDRILMLSTCFSYEATDTRRVVAFAKEILT